MSETWNITVLTWRAVRATLAGLRDTTPSPAPSRCIPGQPARQSPHTGTDRMEERLQARWMSQCGRNDWSNDAADAPRSHWRPRGDLLLEQRFRRINGHIRRRSGGMMACLPWRAARGRWKTPTPL